MAVDWSKAANAALVAKAEALKPTLRTKRIAPRCLAGVVADRTAFQGWRIASVGEASVGLARTLRRGDSLIFDFGEHLVGQLTFSMEFVGPAMDAPARVQFIFAEMPCELAEPFEPYTGELSRAWLQDETINIDMLPATVQLPRRYAFRYVKVTVIDTSPVFGVKLTGIHVDAGTSADFELPASAAILPEDLAQIDRVSMRTLASCMQTVFEDGPKRDRRLWMGDMRLQALANYESFRNYDLVKRCFYLFAGLPREDGLIPACVYETPKPYIGHCTIPDYCAFFGPALMEYAEASGDWELVRELWPTIVNQLELQRFLDADGLFRSAPGWWLFIDWAADLDKHAAVHAVFVYSFQKTWELAEKFGKTEDVAFLPALIEKMKRIARAELFDAPTGLFVSGTSRQISWATQAWMIIAGIMTAEEGKRALRALEGRADAVKPAGPYLYHYILEAMALCGMYAEMLKVLRDYWGGMARRGADTFWEVFDPAHEKLSPYNNHLINSYCHAWSCTPTYFLRKYGGELLKHK